MAAAAKVRNAIVHNLNIRKQKALGNSTRGLKEVASDLVNQFTGGDSKRLSALSDMTFLSTHTLARLSSLAECESGAPYRPNCDTVERVMRAFDMEVNFKEVAIKGKYKNQPKEDV